MMDARQFLDFIVRPTLERLDPVIPWSLAAEQLVLGTALHESKLTYVDQLAPGPGPAYGIFQMERMTHDDLWQTFIPFQQGLKEKLLDLAGHDSAEHPPVEELWGNNFYACAMCRVRYRRARPALPLAGDALALARYWKAHYNTVEGKGSVEQALPAFERAVQITITRRES